MLEEAHRVSLALIGSGPFVLVRFKTDLLRLYSALLVGALVLRQWSCNGQSCQGVSAHQRGVGKCQRQGTSTENNQPSVPSRCPSLGGMKEIFDGQVRPWTLVQIVGTERGIPIDQSVSH